MTQLTGSGSIVTFFAIYVVDLLDYEGALTDADTVKTKITGTLDKFDDKQLQAVFALVRGIRK